MEGNFSVIDALGRHLSDSRSLRAAEVACRCHLATDGEQGPLVIFAPDGKKIASAEINECGRVTIRSSSLARPYDIEPIEEVRKRWGSPMTED